MLSGGGWTCTSHPHGPHMPHADARIGQGVASKLSNTTRVSVCALRYLSSGIRDRVVPSTLCRGRTHVHVNRNSIRYVSSIMGPRYNSIVMAPWCGRANNWGGPKARARGRGTLAWRMPDATSHFHSCVFGLGLAYLDTLACRISATRT